MIRATSLLLLLLAAACSSRRETYLERDVTTVLILPPVTAAVHPDAWRDYWPPLFDAVLSRGYRAVKLEAVEKYFSRKFSTVDPEVIRQTSPRELARAFGVDGVVYAQITKASSSWMVMTSSVTMEADFELVEGKTEEIVWKYHAIVGEKREVEKARGQDAIFGMIQVASASMDAKPAEYWNRCVGEGISRLPHAGRDPEATAGPAADGSFEKKTAQPAPAKDPATPPPPPAAPQPPYVVDSAGWTLAVARGFVLLSSVAGTIEETPGGFKLKIGQQNYELSENQGLCIFKSKNNSMQMTMNGVPEGWDGNLVAEYRRALSLKPGMKIQQWLRDRLARIPARHIQGLLD